MPLPSDEVTPPVTNMYFVDTRIYAMDTGHKGKNSPPAKGGFIKKLCFMG
ncbi:MAG: hypothetical protein Kow0075_03820 [Salibacteraceae bacterium]